MATKKPAKRAAKVAAPAPTPIPTPAPVPAAQSRAEQFSDAFTGFEQQLAAHLATAGAWAKSHLRQRTLLVWLVPIFVLAALWATDPDGGASVKVWAIRLLTAVVAVGLAHWGRKAMFDYPEADVQSLFSKARDEPTGAGLALIAVAIVLAALLAAFASFARADTLELERAKVYLPALTQEVDRTWAAHPQRNVLAGQISNETACPRTRSCWLPTAQLKSAREEGAGFPQLTRTYRADGSIRFDALQELVDRHPALRELSWENVYRRPDLQMRAFLLKAHDDYNVFAAVADSHERMVFGLVSHNRGTGGVQNERRACKLSPPCDPGKWAKNVEQHCTASRVALYGNRSACDISRAYPKDIIVRAQRYVGLV
jgi:hypothetical protein